MRLTTSPFIASYVLIGVAIALGLAAASLGRRRGSGALWLAASSLIALAALDAEVSVLFWPRITVAGGQGPFIVADPLLGYGPRPGAVAKVAWRRLGRVIYQARYTIDARGFRVTLGSPDPSAPTTLFVGDSYTFGDGLNDADTLPQQFAAATGYRQRVINGAFSGYATNQVLALIDSDRIAADFGTGRRLIVYPAIDEHLGRIDGRSPLHRAGTPHYGLDGDRLVFLGPFHPGLAGRVVDLASKSAIVASLRDLSLAAPSARGARLFGAMVQRAAEEAKSRYAANFLVVLWDEPVWQDGGDKTRARQRAAAIAAMATQMTARGVPFVRVSQLVPDYPARLAAYVIAGSGHPSALLNRRLAGALARFLLPRGEKELGPF